MVAAAITNYNGGGDSDIADPSIGQLKFYLKHYGHTADINLGFSELESRPCTDTDLNNVNGDNDESDFYPLGSASEKDMKAFGHRLQCLTHPEKLKLQGNFDTSLASNLMIVFEECT